MTLEQARASEARKLSSFYAGRTDAHPQGGLARRFILPRMLSSDTRDSKDWRFSEWGEAAGMTPAQDGEVDMKKYTKGKGRKK